MNSPQHSIGSEQYEELCLALDAKGYKKELLVMDDKQKIKNVFRIERWNSEGNPSFLVVIEDDNDITVWGAPAIWVNNGPDSSGFAEYIDQLMPKTAV